MSLGRVAAAGKGTVLSGYLAPSKYQIGILANFMLKQ
jgi:hypothetical protein